jgi:hypothetical protein
MARVSTIARPALIGAIVIGLAAAGGVLLIAIVIVLASSMKPEVEEPLTNPLTTSSGVATIAPQIEVPDTGAGTVAPSAADAGTAVGENSTPQAKSTSTPQPKPKPRTDPPTPKPVSTVSGAAACDACLSAAPSGNVQGAAAPLGRCDDAAHKLRCRNTPVMLSAGGASLCSVGPIRTWLEPIAGCPATASML